MKAEKRRPIGPDTQRKRQKEQTRIHILATARKLFIDRGFEATTTKVIAQAAGISEGAIFGHFANKAEILRALYQDEVEKFIVIANEEVWKKQTARARLHRLFALVLDNLPAPELVGSLISYTWIWGAEAEEEFQQYAEPWYAVVRRILAQGMDRGEIDQTIDVPAAITVLDGGQQEIIRQFVNSAKSKEALLRSSRAVVDIVVDGLAPR